MYQQIDIKNKLWLCDHCVMRMISHHHGDQEVHKSKMASGHNNCGKDFVRNTSQHSIIHSEGQTSDENGKGINLGCDLELQQQLQVGEEPHMCSECGKGLSQSSHMQTHQRANPGEKPYRCQVCAECFNQNSSLPLMSPFTPGWICIDVASIGRASVMS